MAANENDEGHSDQTTLNDSAVPQRRLSTPTSSKPMPEPQPQKYPWRKEAWSKVKVSPRQSKNILKQSLPAAICLALFQADWIANYFTINGYIFALIALVIIPTQPRARFLRVLVQCILSTCLAAATGLLALWCGIQARRHTISPSAPAEKYNSSQAVILGAWLLFSIWTASVVKSAYPVLTMPVLLSEIYLIVALTSGVNLQTMDAAMEFSDKLLVNFMLGLSVATGVSLFVFPLSCRTVFFESVSNYFATMRKTIKTQQTFLSAMRERDPWCTGPGEADIAELTAHKKALEGLYAAAADVRGNLEFAGKEPAWGNLNKDQMSELSDRALRIMPAFAGLGFVYDVLSQSTSEQRVVLDAADERKLTNEWQVLMQGLHQPFLDLSAAMDLALEHILLTLGLKKRSKDATSEGSAPGTARFVTWYIDQTTAFSNQREVVARMWAENEGVQIPDSLADKVHKLDRKSEVEGRLAETDKKPFTVIYIHYLLYAASLELLELITFVDSMNADGTLLKRHLILPTYELLQHWITGLFHVDEHSESKLSPQAQIMSYSAKQPISTPKTKVRKDPEHLPATRWWEIIGNYVRLFPKLMRSAHASHGLRVACAVMSVAIGFYIKSSSEWFSTNRWLWAMFAVVLTMNRTAGTSVFSFVARISGTIAAMAASFAIYYMVVGHTTGVLVMLWVWFLVLSYIMVCYPFLLPTVVVTYMASVVMVGNELQDQKLGFARVTASGQAAHDEYLLAPERLAVVSAGVVIGFFWTIFPYPLSEHTELRQDLASTFYYLASHHSMVAKTVVSRAEGLYPHMATRNQNNLARARIRSFTKLQFLFSRLKQHLKFIRFQVILGGKFPTAQYTELITLCEQICTASNVITYASISFVRAWELANNAGNDDNRAQSELKWLRDFRDVLGNVDKISDDITSTLVMLSNHMTSASPFPPSLRNPEEGRMAKTVRELGGHLLTVTHITEPGYAAFVTMTVAGRGIGVALTRQVEICKELVGVLDFSSYLDVDLERGGDRVENEEKAERMGPTGWG